MKEIEILFLVTILILKKIKIKINKYLIKKLIQLMKIIILIIKIVLQMTQVIIYYPNPRIIL